MKDPIDWAFALFIGAIALGVMLSMALGAHHYVTTLPDNNQAELCK